MNNAQNHETILEEDLTFGLGEIRILHPPGTFAITPASLISIQTIGQHKDLLQGIGIDWGSGAGCLSIAAAKTLAVHKVWGLEISAANVDIALKNAQLNGVEGNVISMHADSYQPFSDDDRKALESIKEQAHFVLANPPSSENDDGFEYRRIVLRGARKYLVDGGLVFLNISYQYGLARIEQLAKEIPGFTHEGILASTDWVPFDLGRPDLLHCLQLYAREEVGGGFEYTFSNPLHPDENINAQAALQLYHKTKQSPLSKWQTHLFRYRCS